MLKSNPSRTIQLETHPNDGSGGAGPCLAPPSFWIHFVCLKNFFKRSPATRLRICRNRASILVPGQGCK